MNNETIDKNLYNGTTNQGPYKEIINQLNQSVPLITSNTLSVSNKSQGNTSSIEKPATLGLLNDTKLPANVKQQNTLLQSSNLKQQRSRIGGGLLGERRTLPVTSDYHNVFIHLRKGSDGGKYRSWEGKNSYEGEQKIHLMRNARDFALLHRCYFPLGMPLIYPSVSPGGEYLEKVNYTFVNHFSKLRRLLALSKLTGQFF